VLVHVIRRYHYELDTLEQGEVVGFRSPGPLVIGAETDYAFGTTVAIRPGSCPAGVAGGIPHQLAVIRDILAECQGVVQWGGSLRRPHESHVQIDVTPTDPRLKKVVDRIRGWSDFPARAPESWQWAPDRRFSPAGGALPSSWLPLHLQHLPGLHFGW
jgi:hypothetical protein